MGNPLFGKLSLQCESSIKSSYLLVAYEILMRITFAMFDLELRFDFS